MTDKTFESPPGLVTVTSHGIIQAQSFQALWEMRSFTEAQGLKNIQWATIPGSLVDKARNDAGREMLQRGLQWLVMIDADMVFAPNALILLLQTAFGSHPWADVIGGYCNLRGDVAIPTIDTGTGTWESHYPGEGVLEVMRTGGAFLLVKRHVLERIPFPWFATRIAQRPLDALHEVDNFARQKYDGTNPLREDPAWLVLEEMAREQSLPFTPSEVGEDSGFCDRVKAHGMRIVVHTDLITGHLHQETIDWQRHRRAMDERASEHRLLCGILS